MVNVSAEFKTAMKQPIKELRSYIKLPADTYIRSEDDLISVKISGEGGLLKTVMRSFEGRYLGDHNILGLEVQVGIGVKLADGSTIHVGLDGTSVLYSTANPWRRLRDPVF